MMASSQPTPSRPHEGDDGSKDTLSLPAKALYTLGLPLTTSALYVYSPATALCVPFVAAPTAALLYQRSSNPPSTRPAHLETLIWSFTGAATIAPVVSMVAQGILSYATAALVFGAQTNDYVQEFTRSATEVRAAPLDLTKKRVAMAHSWRYLAYLTFFSFSLAGLPEEGMKYGILKLIQRQYRRAGRKMTNSEYIIYARAIGLGFSFFENLAYIFVAARTGESRNMLFVTAAERILYGTAAHVLTAVLTAIRMARSSESPTEDSKLATTEVTSPWWRTILPSVLYHGAGNTALLAACASDGHPGWVHPETVGSFVKCVFAPVALMTGLGVQVARQLREMRVSWNGLNL